MLADPKGAGQEVAISVTDSSARGALDALRRDLTTALTESKGTIALDLSNIDVIDSSILVAVATASNQAVAAGRSMTVKVSPRLSVALAEWRIDTIISLSEAEPSE